MVTNVDPVIFVVRKDVRVKKMYTGSMRITNQAFQEAYEDPNSTEFKTLANQIAGQVRKDTKVQRSQCKCIPL